MRSATTDGIVSQNAAREHTLAKRIQMEAKRDEALSRELGVYECRECGMECPYWTTFKEHIAVPCKLNVSAPLWRTLTGRLYI